MSFGFGLFLKSSQEFDNGMCSGMFIHTGSCEIFIKVGCWQGFFSVFKKVVYSS